MIQKMGPSGTALLPVLTLASRRTAAEQDTIVHTAKRARVMQAVEDSKSQLMANSALSISVEAVRRGDPMCLRSLTTALELSALESERGGPVLAEAEEALAAHLGSGEGEALREVFVAMRALLAAGHVDMKLDAALAAAWRCADPSVYSGFLAEAVSLCGRRRAPQDLVAILLDGDEGSRLSWAADSPEVWGAVAGVFRDTPPALFREVLALLLSRAEARPSSVATARTLFLFASEGALPLVSLNGGEDVEAIARLEAKLGAMVRGAAADPLRAVAPVWLAHAAHVLRVRLNIAHSDAIALAQTVGAEPRALPVALASLPVIERILRSGKDDTEPLGDLARAVAAYGLRFLSDLSAEPRDREATADDLARIDKAASHVAARLLTWGTKGVVPPETVAVRVDLLAARVSAEGVSQFFRSFSGGDTLIKLCATPSSAETLGPHLAPALVARAAQLLEELCPSRPRLQHALLLSTASHPEAVLASVTTGGAGAGAGAGRAAAAVGGGVVEPARLSALVSALSALVTLKRPVPGLAAVALAAAVWLPGTEAAARGAALLRDLLLEESARGAAPPKGWGALVVQVAAAAGPDSWFDPSASGHAAAREVLTLVQVLGVRAFSEACCIEVDAGAEGREMLAGQWVTSPVACGPPVRVRVGVRAAPEGALLKEVSERVASDCPWMWGSFLYHGMRSLWYLHIRCVKENSTASLAARALGDGGGSARAVVASSRLVLAPAAEAVIARLREAAAQPQRSSFAAAAMLLSSLLLSRRLAAGLGGVDGGGDTAAAAPEMPRRIGEALAAVASAGPTTCGLPEGITLLSAVASSGDILSFYDSARPLALQATMAVVHGGLTSEEHPPDGSSCARFRSSEAVFKAIAIGAPLQAFVYLVKDDIRAVEQFSSGGGGERALAGLRALAIAYSTTAQGRSRGGRRAFLLSSAPQVVFGAVRAGVCALGSGDGSSSSSSSKITLAALETVLGALGALAGLKDRGSSQAHVIGRALELVSAAATHAPAVTMSLSVKIVSTAITHFSEALWTTAPVLVACMRVLVAAGLGLADDFGRGKAAHPEVATSALRGVARVFGNLTSLRNMDEVVEIAVPTLLIDLAAITAKARLTGYHRSEVAMAAFALFNRASASDLQRAFEVLQPIAQEWLKTVHARFESTAKFKGV
jgi:hypothetical protein